MTSTELEQRPAAATPTSADLTTLWKLAGSVAMTEFVPKGIRNRKEAVFACILYGQEQGLAPMTALREVDFIDGEPTLSAAMVTAKIRDAGHKLWREEHRDESGKVVGTTAHGERRDGTRDSYTFTLDMAKRAGLAGKKNWQTYPEAMLWARAVSQLARFLFADVFSGSVYTADELGAETGEDGRVVTAEEDTATVDAIEEAEAIIDAEIADADVDAENGTPEQDEIPF